MAQVNLNIDELKTFFGHIVKNNQHIQAEGKVPVAVNIEGEAGIGKTSSILQLSKELNMSMVKLSLSQIEEIGDLVGFPVKEFEMIKEDGTTAWVQESTMPMYIQSKYKPTGEKRMTHAAPEWIQGKEEGGFLILDDYTRADQRFMQACMEIIDRQEYISWKLPKNWHVILTSNPDNGNYLVTSLDDAQKTRFITVNLTFDIDCWARWAESANIDSRCINFLLMHPDLVTEKTNARSITTFFNSISSIPDFQENLPLIQMIGEGSVGAEFSTMFTMFINNRLDKMIHPKDIINNPNWAYVKGELLNSIGKDDSYRADIASVMTTRTINYALNYAEKNTVDQKIIDRIIALTTDEDVFTNDLKYYIIKGIVNGNKTKFTKLMMNPEVVKMAVK
jgi:hypothetical protein